MHTCMHVASVQPKETFLQGHACMPVAKVQPKDPVCLQIYPCMHVASVQPKGPFLQVQVQTIGNSFGNWILVEH